MTSKSRKPAKVAFSSQKPVCRSPEVLSRKGKNKTLHVLHLNQYSVCYSIDGVALEFWELINGKRTPAKLVALLQKKHKKRADEVPAKVQYWLKQLKNYRLIR